MANKIILLGFLWLLVLHPYDDYDDHDDDYDDDYEEDDNISVKVTNQKMMPCYKGILKPQQNDNITSPLHSYKKYRSTDC